MQIQLNAGDVFKAAIMLEERAVRFYVAAAEAADGRARKLLENLADMERGHARQFSTPLAEAVDSRLAAVESPDQEADDFLQALTSDRIITRECQVVAGDTYDVILEKAMLIEKNSVFFYTTVKEIMQSQMAAGAVERIIHEEVSHFSMLSEALKKWRWQK
ncbi:MAG: hypothetical protein ACD_39C01345G0002 [uncultured bacterium]|nr:MAG: hypothetical protein ACD_39C01345G0002 [uncultured bacterium]